MLICVGDGAVFRRWDALWRVIASLLLIAALVSMYPEVYHSFTLPVKGEMFVGREAEVEELTDLIGNSAVSIVSIVGSPGFGKSTLAVHVGHVHDH